MMQTEVKGDVKKRPLRWNYKKNCSWHSSPWYELFVHRRNKNMFAKVQVSRMNFLRRIMKWGTELYHIVLDLRRIRWLLIQNTNRFSSPLDGLSLRYGLFCTPVLPLVSVPYWITERSWSTPMQSLYCSWFNLHWILLGLLSSIPNVISSHW